MPKLTSAQFLNVIQCDDRCLDLNASRDRAALELESCHNLESRSGL